MQVNSVTGLCITKLDVLDGLDVLRICVAYRIDGKDVESPPIGADDYKECEPIYIDMPGWEESTLGVKSYADLPQNAKAYLKRVEELLGVPVHMVSTGPERDQSMFLQNPFH
jgi:adenylosuccinate synthase